MKLSTNSSIVDAKKVLRSLIKNDTGLIKTMAGRLLSDCIISKNNKGKGDVNRWYVTAVTVETEKLLFQHFDVVLHIFRDRIDKDEYGTVQVALNEQFQREIIYIK